MTPKISSLRQRANHISRRWVDPIISIRRLKQSVPLYVRYYEDWQNYLALPGAEPLHLKDAYPQLLDRTTTTSYDDHYFYQAVWATRKILENAPDLHVDIGSHLQFVGQLTALTNILFIDIRPAEIRLDNFRPIEGDIISVPFADNSLGSISCLHVAEHIGLGRYGDPLDPDGTRKAARELTRVLAPQGQLYFSLPVGRPRVCFNAHRIHSPVQILDYFDGLRLASFSCVLDDGSFQERVDTSIVGNANYGCGLFQFTKDFS